MRGRSWLLRVRFSTQMTVEFSGKRAYASIAGAAQEHMRALLPRAPGRELAVLSVGAMAARARLDFAGLMTIRG